MLSANIFTTMNNMMALLSILVVDMNTAVFMSIHQRANIRRDLFFASLICLSVEKFLKFFVKRYNDARQMATSDVRFRHKKFPFRNEKSCGVPLDFLTKNSYVLNRGFNLFPSFLFFGQARSLFGVKINY